MFRPPKPNVRLATVVFRAGERRQLLYGDIRAPTVLHEIVS